MTGPGTQLELAPSALAQLVARDALALYEKGALSPVELVRDTLARIDTVNPQVNCFAHVDHDGALAAARASEARWQSGRPCGPLDGVPVTVKDLTPVAGMPTRYGSLASKADGPWDVDAPVAAHLRSAGAVIVGKTTTSEFGWKAVTDTPLHGVTRNPWDLARTPGGSSGGAAVAAYLNLGLLHVGSDAGGSIRIPASFTGTFGFKPTFGVVPQWPASAMGILSHLGPITRAAADAALLLDVLARPDPRDGYIGHPSPHDFTAPVPSPLKGLKIAFSPDLGYVSVDPAIAACVKRTVERLERHGAIVEEISPAFENPIESFETLFRAGISQLADRFEPDHFARLEPGLREHIGQGQALSASQYLRAERARVRLVAHMQGFHQRHDVLITPTMPVSPFPVARLVPEGRGMSNWYDWALFSYPFNMIQQPAASVPCGVDGLGLPVGVQIVGARFADADLLRVAAAIENLAHDK